MADPVVSLEPARIAVEPGGQARATVTITNEGSIVEGYRVEVLDELTGRAGGEGPARWSHVLAPGGGAEVEGTPPAASDVVTVYPGQSETAVVVFAPPAGSRVPGGACAFAVRVASVVDPGASAVVEGDLDVGRVMALQGKLMPVTSSGRWHGNHVIRLSNHGNTPVRLALTAEDPDQALGFLLRPDAVELPVSGEGAVRVKVRTRRPRLRGAVARLPFTVVAEPAGHGAAQHLPVSAGTGPGGVVVDGAFTQKPILTATAVLGAVLLVSGAAALTAFGLSQRQRVPSYEELGVPATPELAAEATGPDSIRLSWTPVDRVERYDLLHLVEGVADGKDELDPSLGAYPVAELEPGTVYCYQLVSVRGVLSSTPSEDACAQTEAAPTPTTAPPSAPPTVSPTADPTEPSPAPSETSAGNGGGDPKQGPTGGPTGGSSGPAGSPGFDTGEWVAILATYAEESTPGEAGARALQATLFENDVAAGLLRTADVPVLAEKNWRPAWWVYLDGFDTSDEARQACEQVKDAELIVVCTDPVQPVPAR